MLRKKLFLNRIPSRVSLFVLALLLAVSIPAFGARFEKQIAEGVTFIQDVRTDTTVPQVINILKINPKKTGVRLESALGGDTIIENNVTKGREVVSSTVARKNALAGINGDYFPYTGDPLGLAISGGELISEPMGRVAVGITADGGIVIDKVNFTGVLTAADRATYPLKGLNRQRGKNEILIYTPVFGADTGTSDGVELAVSFDAPLRVNTSVTATVVSDPTPATKTPIPMGGAIVSASGPAASWLCSHVRAGDQLCIRFDIKSDAGTAWDRVVEAIGGGPWLVQKGVVQVDAADQGFNASFSGVRHPRTAAGVNANDELLLVTVDGRQSISKGMTLSEIGNLMKSLGAVNAINLDGGGSTALSIRGIVNNSPSEGKERPVANALIVYADSIVRNSPKVRFADAGQLTAAIGERRQIKLLNDTNDEPIWNDVCQSLIWGTTGGIGFVDQSGWFTPLKTGKGTIVVLSGDSRVELPVIVTSGKPAKLTAKIVTGKDFASNTGGIEAKVTDASGNPVPNVAVMVKVTGGTPDADVKATDSTGSVSFLVTWDTTAAAAKVRVTAAGLSADAVPVK